MRRNVIATAIAAAATAVPAIALPVSTASASSTVTYASCQFVNEGLANLLSTAGNANRINNHVETCQVRPPNRPVKVRNLLSGGGVTGEVSGLNNVTFSFSSPYPYSKSQCWVPAGGGSGVLTCTTLTQ